MAAQALEIRGNLQNDYQDILTGEALDALNALAGLDQDRQALMKARIERRNNRARNKQRIRERIVGSEFDLHLARKRLDRAIILLHQELPNFREAPRFLQAEHR